MEVTSTIQPYAGKSLASNEDFVEDLDGFLRVVFRSRLEQKLPLLIV